MCHRITVLPSQHLLIAQHCLGHPSLCRRLVNIWLPPTKTEESIIRSILVQHGTLHLVRLLSIILHWQAAVVEELSTRRSMRVVFNIRLISASRGHPILRCLRPIQRWRPALTLVLLLRAIGLLLHHRKRENLFLRRKETGRCFAPRTTARHSINAPVLKGFGPPSSPLLRANLLLPP